MGHRAVGTRRDRQGSLKASADDPRCGCPSHLFSPAGDDTSNIRLGASQGHAETIDDRTLSDVDGRWRDVRECGLHDKLCHLLCCAHYVHPLLWFVRHKPAPARVGVVSKGMIAISPTGSLSRLCMGRDAIEAGFLYYGV